MSTAQPSGAMFPAVRAGLSKRRFTGLFKNLMIWIPLIGLLLFFVYPLITIIEKSFHLRDGTLSLANYVSVLHTSGIIDAIINSFVLGLAATVVGVVLGFTIAYALERSNIRGKKAISGVLNVPLLAPSLVQGIGLIFIFGRNGLIAQATGWDMNIYGFWGLLISDVFWALPQAVMILQATLRNADARYYEAAEVMGASRWRQFFDITLPNAKFGLLNAGFVVFILTITDFGNAFVIGGNYNVLAMQIYNEVNGQRDFGMGAVVGVVLLLPSLISIYIERVASQRQFGTSSAEIVPMRPSRARGRDSILSAVCWGTGVFIIAVVAVVVFASFVRLWPYNMHLTLHSYSVDVSGGYSSLWTTLEISVAVAICSVIALFMLAFGLKHKSGVVAKTAYFLGIMPVGVPGLVIGLAYIFAFNSQNSALYLLYGSATLIGICNFYHYHTQGFLTMMTGMRAVPDALEEVVDCLGGGIRHTVRDAVLPFMAPTVISVFFFMFMRSMVTLSAVIFLVTATVNVASVAIMTLEHDGYLTQAAAFSTLVMLVVAASMIVMRMVLGYMNRRIGTIGG